jgi:hypothetical protein
MLPMDDLRYRVMRMSPCFHISPDSIADAWTWHRLCAFMRKKSISIKPADLDIVGIHSKTQVSVHTDRTWVYLDYISNPIRGRFKIVCYVVIME